MLEAEMKSKIDKLWNMFWAGGLANPLTAIEQMSYLIFMKRLEDFDNVQKMRSDAREEEYRSVFDQNENCRWSRWKFMNAREMYKHVSETVFPFIKELHNGSDVLYSQYMHDATFMIPKPSLLQEAVSLIDDINIGERPDIQGDVYEHLLGELSTAGKNGQFRTPRHIIRMMVELIDPDIGDKICDPACGTGGFLIAAYQHILKKYTTPEMVKIDPDGTPHNLIGDQIVNRENWRLLWEKSFYGYDFDVTMVRISLMNMILHGIATPNIIQMDALSKQFKHESKYDVVLANPPFAGYIDSTDINDGFQLDTTKTELLFLELFYNLLAIGGRAAVIIPNGVLFGSTNAHLASRKLMLEECDLQAVITMPGGVFYPYTGVATAILVFVKGGTTEKVWFYDMKSDGYTLDQRRRIIDGMGDITEIVTKFRNGRLESDQSKLVTIDEIKNNGYLLNPNRYGLGKTDIPEHLAPTELITELITREKEIQELLKEIKNNLQSIGGGETE